jgi:F0F1-type ATP synthase delta subunit
MFSIKQTTQSLLEINKRHPNKTKQIVKIFIDFLKENRTVCQLPSIIRSLEEIEKKQSKENRLHITLFEPVSEQVIQKIKEFVGASDESDIDIEIGKEIEGGFLAHYKGFIFDDSIRNQFIKFTNTLKI